MIKFFRKFRQQLVDENRLGKYLLYAVGEIILVVLGILIALQINNQNENRKSQQKEIILLSEMKANLTSDLQDIEFNIEENRKQTTSNKTIYYTLENRLALSDSLNYHFGKIFGNFQLVENTSAWENLKSIGLDLISNDSLRSTISYLYSVKYIYLDNVERKDDKFQFDYLYPEIIEHLSTEGFGRPGSPRDYKKMLSDEKFIEILKMNISFRDFMQDQYEEVRDLIVTLIEQIDQHREQLYQ